MNPSTLECRRNSTLRFPWSGYTDGPTSPSPKQGPRECTGCGDENNKKDFLDETPNFHYKVDTGNIKQNVQGMLRRYRATDGKIVFGQAQYGNYSYTDRDGKLHLVVFKADENGM